MYYAKTICATGFKFLSSIESGENFVTSETLDKLLKAFDMTSEDFFATNKYKTSDELLKMINLNLQKIADNARSVTGCRSALLCRPL